MPAMRCAKRGLAASRRPPKDHRGHVVGLYAAAQDAAGSQYVLLPCELVEVAWPHPGRQGSLPASASLLRLSKRSVTSPPRRRPAPSPARAAVSLAPEQASWAVHGHLADGVFAHAQLSKPRQNPANDEAVAVRVVGGARLSRLRESGTRSAVVVGKRYLARKAQVNQLLHDLRALFPVQASRAAARVAVHAQGNSPCA